MNSYNRTFTIPADGNKISELDVKNRQIRITVDFNPFFPPKSGKVKVVIKNEYQCTFSHRGDRSHILRLGKHASTELGLKAGTSVKFTVLRNNKYQLVTV